VTFSTHGDQVAFGATRTGEMLAVVFGYPTDVRGIVAATGEVRWSGESRYRPEVAIDRHGTITTIDAPMSPLVQRDLATGEKLREIPIDSCMVSASADGGTQTIALSTKHGTLELLGRDGRVRVSLPHAGTQAQWLDDGTVVATDGKHVTRWTANGEPLSAFDLPRDLHAVGDGLAIGAGGHAVVRRGSELVVLQLETTPPKVIARLGLASRATALAWSGDGARLGN
jgi:hypothetical protein